MKNDCVFCAIAAGEIPGFRVFEDDLVLAFLDVNPVSRGHTLVVPKAHWPDVLAIPDAELAALALRVRKVAAHVVGRLGADGFNLLQNNGASAGQSVRHLHFHIVPRYGSGGVAFASGKGDMAELARLAESVRM